MENNLCMQYTYPIKMLGDEKLKYRAGFIWMCYLAYDVSLVECEMLLYLKNEVCFATKIRHSTGVTK